MNNAFERYVDPSFVYKFMQGPDKVLDEHTARTQGVNCISLAHLAMRDLFGYSLPTSLHCYEMFSDTSHFKTVESIDFLEPGDLMWFGLRHPGIPIDQYQPQYDERGTLVNWRDNPVKHVAIYTGEQANDDYLMLHATNIEGTNAVWPLQKFASFKRYERVYRISRLAVGETGS